MAIIAYIGNTINICLEEPDGGDYILKEFQIESAIGDDNKQGTFFVSASKSLIYV